MMPNKDDNAVPAGGVDPALDSPHQGSYPSLCLPLHTSVELFGPASIFPGVDQDGEPIGSDDPFTDIGYSLPEDGHPRTRKTSSPKAKTRDHELHMKTVKELAQLDIGFFMHIDEKAGKATLRRPNCQTVIFLTHKSRWMLAGSRNRTTHGTVAEFATWYRNNIGVS